MPRGSKDIVERGKNTRFDGESAAKAGEKGRAAQRAMRPVTLCLKGIASETLYGHPSLPYEQLSPVAKFFHIKAKEVTFAHLALFKQAVEMARGDADALNLVASYAGEKPAESVALSVDQMPMIIAAPDGSVVIDDSNQGVE